MTFCISSQAGCALQCSFCATGAMGFSRNLAVHEIAGQVRELALLDPPLRATNIVFMGMGEPLMNWKAVDVVLTILNDPKALGIGARHITVSTVGVLPGVIALGQRKEQFRLAISIHAPSDELRQKLMPVNTKFPLAADVIAAAAAFDRRVTFEYVMLGGVNDQPQACPMAPRARAAVQGVREPDPAASRRVDGLHADDARGDRQVRAPDPQRRRGGRHPEEPRDRHRRGLRTATGRTAAPARRQAVPSTIVRST